MISKNWVKYVESTVKIPNIKEIVSLQDIR